MSEGHILAGRPAGRMTETEYERERARLRELYGENSTQAAAKRDQALAVLFARSGWTQEQLAQKEKRSPQWVARRLRFGRFLNFSPMGENPDSLPNNLTERRFRQYWERSDKTETNERIRFLAVRRLIEEETVAHRTRRPKIGKAIVEQFGDGEWHALAKIAAATAEGDEEHAAATIRTMMALGTYGVKAESRPYRASQQFRIFRAAQSVSSEEIRTKLDPVIAGLEAEGKKNMATMSPGTVARLAFQLRQLRDDWIK